MTIQQYIETIIKHHKLGNATEHTFRGALSQLIESIVPEVTATNEPKRQKCGAPDYILTKKDIPVGFIEAKDLGDKDLAGLKKTGNKEQFDRYKASLNNIFFTDYLDFHLYREGQFVTSIAIATIQNGEIVALPENFQAFTNLLKDFCNNVGQTIKSSKKLAEMMAAKARLLSDVIERAIVSDEETLENSTLREQMIAFKQILIHDITPKAFADVYAQTIAYGMFAARYHDPTLQNFSRQEAAELIPKTNPFLRKLFGYIAGPDIDDRIKWIVDSLVEIFLACNIVELLQEYGKATKMEDPIIHFYETFLSEYDPSLRKARGVWYTPQPVVNFIVRAVDDILKTEFDLPQGLADSSKTKIKVNLQATDKRYKDNIRTVEEEVHRVQILDPATGTGTFLAETIKHIHQKFKGQQGIWSNYVAQHLIPRLNGFELLMASYAMAHLKMDLLLTETGYNPKGLPSFGGAGGGSRFRIYLTNSLEEHHADTGTLFANWLSSEANEANYIKRDTPVMCVIGNPPYSVSSNNKSGWIQNLIADYKKDLNERKINLDDDYIKFIRFGQHFIDKNESGILAYISANSFIDGITHRQMRKHLLESFDQIYILDLHGNTRKKETASDGSADQNVFDIMQGVSINIFIKTGKKKKNELGKVFHFDLQGKREFKYDFLSKNSLKNIPWNELECTMPNFFFIPKDFSNVKEYDYGFKINELFNVFSSGIETQKDSVAISRNKGEITNIINDFIKLEENDLMKKYQIKEGRDWKVKTSKADIIKNGIEKISKVLYRPFDVRYTYLSGFSKGFVAYSRYEVSKNLINKENVALLCCQRQTSFDFQHCFISNLPSERCTVSLQTGEVGYVFPLYLYPTSTGQLALGESAARVPNLDVAIAEKIAACVGVPYNAEGVGYQGDREVAGSLIQPYLSPIDILDYIYAVLHTPSYREKYKEFLKIDFPRVPFPASPNLSKGEEPHSDFWRLVSIGHDLRQLHLMESEYLEELMTEYPNDGDNIVTKPRFVADESDNDYVTGTVYINDTQCFTDVPERAWNFYIGGYQPAQKWLKDRKDRTLDFEDILHYQKIIVALDLTADFMEQLEEVFSYE